jgi:tetratricopeptide (TPR) repeat protein
MKIDSVEALIRDDRWDDAQREIRKQLKAGPGNHWLLTRLGLTYYEQRKYRSSLRFSEQALKIAPKCPLAIWDHAGTLQMLDRHAEAIRYYRRLLRRGPEGIANGPCGEGLGRARGLVADCHYRIAESLRALGKKRAAMRSFEAHLDMRGPGCYSIYPLRSLGQLQRPRTNRRVTP